jgi:ferredoxin
MKVIVDMDLCQDHGQCAIAAPEVFRISDDGHLEYDGTPDSTLVDHVEEAADVCPVQAILVGD